MLEYLSKYPKVPVSPDMNSWPSSTMLVLPAEPDFEGLVLTYVPQLSITKYGTTSQRER